MPVLEEEENIRFEGVSTISRDRDSGSDESSLVPLLYNMTPFKNDHMVRKMSESDKKDTANMILAQLQQPKYLQKLLTYCLRSIMT